MSDPTNGFATVNIPSTNISWTVGPREFVFKYIKYIPWLILSIALALVLAYIKIRYMPKIYHVQSSMLIKSDRPGSSGSGDRFNELFMSQGSSNLTNEIQILSSRPVLQRVVRDLHLETRYYGSGKILSSLAYPEAPVRLQVLSLADSSKGFSFPVSIVNGKEFTLGKPGKRVSFGEPFEIGRNRCILFYNESVNLRIYPTPDFLVRWDPVDVVAENYISSLRISISEQSTILLLTFETENIQLGKDFLNILMQVYDSLIVEDKNRISLNTLDFIKKRLDTLQFELGNLESGIKSFRTNNEVFDVEGQSKMFFDHMTEGSKAIMTQDVKISIVDYLINYISDKRNIYELVPVNLGVEEPALAGFVGEYNKLQLERQSNLKTTTANNPMIASMDNNLEKLRRNIDVALHQVKDAYLISRKSLEQEQNQY